MEPEEEEEEEQEEEEEEEEEEEREPGSSDADDEGGSGSGDDGGDDGGGAGRRAGHASFLAGEKGASFAKAFAKIIGKPVKGPKAAKAAGAGVILAESAGVQKRKVEEEEDAAARHEAKKQRLAMRTRGHLVRGRPPGRGLRLRAACGGTRLEQAPPPCALVGRAICVEARTAPLHSPAAPLPCETRAGRKPASRPPEITRTKPQPRRPCPARVRTPPTTFMRSSCSASQRTALCCCLTP
jgi:hypothetical protein